jgi:sarcosine oxidase, subunit gamma
MNPLVPVRRSFVYRNSIAPISIDGTIDDKRAPASGEAKLKLVDLSVLSRWGMKGREALGYLQTQGAVLPTRDNKAERQRDGSLVARLSLGEALILPALPTGRSSMAEAIESLPPEGRGACYPVLRRDSHCWFIVTGSDAPPMFAKLCAIDLAADQFADGSVAQTSIARLTAIVIRHDIARTVSFSVLAESASAEYLWVCLADAMAEFSGEICGMESLSAAEQL